MTGFGSCSRSEDGGAAIETLIVLPAQIFITCLILQLAHFIVCFQVVHYAAFGAARAALVADPGDAAISGGGWGRLKQVPLGSASFWKGTNAAWAPESRVYRSAAQICSMLELFSGASGATQVQLPTGGSLRRDKYESLEGKFLRVQGPAYDGTANGEVTVQVAYNAHLPIPFANQLFYTIMLDRGSAFPGQKLRVVFLQDCTLVRPWRLKPGS